MKLGAEKSPNANNFKYNRKRRTNFFDRENSSIDFKFSF